MQMEWAPRGRKSKHRPLSILLIQYTIEKCTERADAISFPLPKNPLSLSNTRREKTNKENAQSRQKNLEHPQFFFRCGRVGVIYDASVITYYRFT
jgi:hypothetical protein